MKEDELIKKLKNKDREAYKYLYDRYFQMVRGHVIKNKGDEEAAHEVFQESLIGLLKKIKNKETVFTAKISTLLYAIAQNKWLEELKRLRKEKDLDVERVKKALGHEEVVSSFLKEHIRAALKTLSKECQQVINYFYYQQFPFEEIETRMNYSKGFGKLKRKRCMDTLKKRISQKSTKN